MDNTGEADKKRRHFSSISPTAAKRHHVAPLSAEKTLDAAVLQFQNKRLAQKLETQKVEINALEDKYWKLKDKQQLYERTLDAVNDSWEELVDDLESRSNCTLDFVKHGRGFECNSVKGDGESPSKDALLSQLLETGATESSSASTIANSTEECRKMDGGNTMRTNNIFRNTIASFDDLNNLKRRLYAASLKIISSNGQSQRFVVSSDLQTEIKNLRIAVVKLHLKHRNLSVELQSHRDTDAKNKADLKCLKGEFESAIAEFEESTKKLAVLKSKKDG